MKKALIFSARGLKSFTLDQIKLLQQSLDVRFVSCMKPLSPTRFIQLAGPYSVLGFTRRTIKDLNREMIDQLPSLREVAIYATGYEWVDSAYLAAKGIKLSYLPDYSSASVAEHAMGCLLVLSRRIQLSFDRTRGIAPPWVSLRGWELKGKNLGLIGFGRIGKKIAGLASAFGMKVFVADRKKTGHRNQVSLRRLLCVSDAVVLTSSQERGGGAVLGRANFSWVRPGAVLVNVGRADLVDHGALLPLLRSKKINGYAVDGDVEILRRAKGVEPGRILQTAHTGWYSNEAMKRGTQTWVENLTAFGRGQSRNRVRLKVKRENK